MVGEALSRKRIPAEEPPPPFDEIEPAGARRKGLLMNPGMVGKPLAELTQEELAERAGVSVRTVSDLERGIIQSPQLHTLRQLADALQLAPSSREQFTAVTRRPGVEAKLWGGAEGAAPTTPGLEDQAEHVHTLLLAEPTSFIGRVREIVAIADLLRDRTVRLLTLTGPGGTGKTRLAIQVAQKLLDAFPNGIVFIPLGSISDPSLVAPTVAAALAVKESPQRSLVEALQASLREKRLLLVLDNFEHPIPVISCRSGPSSSTMLWCSLSSVPEPRRLPSP
jgi:transcriptional regulator with XRE-family HTH domain